MNKDKDHDKKKKVNQKNNHAKILRRRMVRNYGEHVVKNAIQILRKTNIARNIAERL